MEVESDGGGKLHCDSMVGLEVVWVPTETVPMGLVGDWARRDNSPLYMFLSASGPTNQHTITDCSNIY